MPIHDRTVPKLGMRALILTALLALTSVAFAQARKSAAAHATLLARTMQVDELARLRLETSVRKEMAEGSATQQELDCVRAAKLDFVLDVYARAILAKLSSDDITRAIAFYASKEGQGFLKYSIAQELRTPEAAPTELTPAEQAALTKFLRTSVGKKIIVGRVLETVESRTSIARGLLALTTKCQALSP